MSRVHYFDKTTQGLPYTEHGINMLKLGFVEEVNPKYLQWLLKRLTPDGRDVVEELRCGEHPNAFDLFPHHYFDPYWMWDFFCKRDQEVITRFYKMASKHNWKRVLVKDEPA